MTNTENMDISQASRGVDVGSVGAPLPELYEAQRQLIADLASNATLPESLEHLTHAIERLAPGLLASVLIAEGGRLRLGAAPTLPEGYNRAVDRVPIGEGFGSCGTAAHRREMVIVDDVERDPLWKNYRAIARQYGIGACWSVPIFGPSGDVLGTFALYYDQPQRPRPHELRLIEEFAKLAAVTIEYNRMKAQVRESEGGLRDLLDDLDVIVWEAEAETRRFTYVSRRAEEILGYPIDRWYSGPEFWECIIHPEDRRATVRTYRDAWRTERSYEFEYRLLTRNRDVVWVRDIVHVKTDPRTHAERLRGVMVNITRQRQAEQERELLFAQLARDRAMLEQAEAAQRLLAEAGSTIATSLDPERTVRKVAMLAVRDLADWCAIFLRNDDGTLRCAALEHRAGVAASLRNDLDRVLPQPGGMPFHLSTVLADGKPELVSQVSTDDFERGALRPEMMRIVRQLGTVSAMVVPLQVPHRKFGAIAFGSASADRPYGPGDLRLAEGLAQRASLALENGRLYREAQAAVRTREEFLSIAAHELRTPLAGLKLALQTMLRQLARPDVDLSVLRERVLAGDRQAARLGRLIDDLLDVSMIRAGKMQLHLEPTDLVETVHKVVARFQGELEHRGVNIVVHAPTPVVGTWDPRRMDQVVTNLLSNALKYGRGRPVHVAIEQKGATATLRVEDQGIGMTAEVRERVFRPFERGVSPGHYGGLGLGLYITAQIVKAHGGSTSVRSAPGEGSTFTIELPRGTAR